MSLSSSNFTSLSIDKLYQIKNKAQIIVGYKLISNYLGGGQRQWNFKVRGLQKVAEQLKEKNIPFFLFLQKTKNDTADEEIIKFIKKHKIGSVVTDFLPLRESLKYKQKIADNVDCVFYEVDAHNIVPCRHVSNKQEYGAYTLRPKIHRKLREFLDDFPEVKKHKIASNAEKIVAPKINWQKILENKEISKIPETSDWILPGEDEAQKVLKNFIKNKLEKYALMRNDANEEIQSNLSPYLHYGMISAQQIVKEIIKHTKTKTADLAGLLDKNKSDSLSGARDFLEELIVRRELSDNFCFYNKNYDNFLGFPDWAKKTLNIHRRDKRDYIYTKSEFEKAKTHDDLWNACQLEMTRKGKMHGYMRMYWAKKILEWSKDPETAQQIAIYLNDKYELDGRDPNGYAGIAWCIGGVHDRAWFNRSIFGNIRYMARSGCEKKFNIKKYIELNHS